MNLINSDIEMIKMAKCWNCESNVNLDKDLVLIGCNSEIWCSDSCRKEYRNMRKAITFYDENGNPLMHILFAKIQNLSDGQLGIIHDVLGAIENGESRFRVSQVS